LQSFHLIVNSIVTSAAVDDATLDVSCVLYRYMLLITLRTVLRFAACSNTRWRKKCL